LGARPRSRRECLAGAGAGWPVACQIEQADRASQAKAGEAPVGGDPVDHARSLEHLGDACDEIAAGVQHASPLAGDVMVEPSAGKGAVKTELSPRRGMWTSSGVDAGDECAGTRRVEICREPAELIDGWGMWELRQSELVDGAG
jgi:hypothetical protein